MKPRTPIYAHVLRRDITSHLPAVESLCREIRSLLQQHGLAAVAFPVELSARECLNNAALHGNQRVAAKRIVLDLMIGRKWIRLQVRDQGRGYDWRRARAAALSGNTKTSGRGLAICTLYAERITFNQRGNCITIWLAKTKKEQ